jgi:hypothetical protein
MLNFDLDTVITTEFGVGYEDAEGQAYCCISVDGDVQDALQDMAVATWNSMKDITINPDRYDPSEKYSSFEHVFLPLDDNLAQTFRDVHGASNLEINNTALDEPSFIYSYFALFTDSQGRHLTAIRRASQFKGVLKKRLIRFSTDAMKIIEDNVFKLDNDFDLLIDSTKIHILRPSGFEFVGELRDAVLASVQQNINAIRPNLSFVDFAGIESYASTHSRAARYLASIKSQRETENIDKNALLDLCNRTGVEVNDTNGTVTVEDLHVMGFLEVLDRRRYEINLVTESPEQYRAASRQKIDN